MQKKFSKSDITVRPFKTHKNWVIQSIDSSSADVYGDSTFYTGKMVINEGLNISGSFYPSSSAYYNPTSEPVNQSGEYKRITYSAVDSLFYRNSDNPLNQFGVEFVGENPITKEKEVRKISDRVLVSRIGRNCWGEKINPKSVQLTDYSNPHEPMLVCDDGFTNLYISGSHFPYTNTLFPYNAEESHSYWDSVTGQFYYLGEPVSYAEAQEAKNAGGTVQYVPDSDSWKYTTTGSLYHPENERFGQSVSAWFKYVLVGSPTDIKTISSKKNGRADIYKYDPETERHRLVKTLRSPFTNSYQDGFGCSVSIRDDFAVVGSITEDECTVDTGSGIVYVYDKYAGGADHWRLINILEGSGSSAQFGASVSHDQGILAVGAPGVNNGAGAVYIYRQKQFGATSCMGIPTSSFWSQISSESGSCSIIVTESGSLFEIYDEQNTPYFVSGNFSWEWEATITSSTPGDRFGYSVAVSSDKILVGTNITSSAGYASLFTASYTGTCPTASWSRYKTFVGNEDYADLSRTTPFTFVEVPQPVDGFGYKVAMDGNHLAVCAYYDKGFTPYASSNITQSLGAVYFYSFGTDAACSVYDCTLRYKTFGDRSVTQNSNFARSVTLSNGIAAVGYVADKTVWPVNYATGSLILDGWTLTSTSSQDESLSLGRVSIFSYDSQTVTWDLVRTMKRNKEKDSPFYNYGWSTALSDSNSGSMFLAVGAPVFNYPQNLSTYNYILTSSLADSTFMSASIHGAAFVYDMGRFENNPKIGNVFYRNGQLVVTSPEENYKTIMSSTGSHGFSLAYQGTHTIYEHEYLVSVTPSQFNYSTNPASLANYPMLLDVNQDGVFDMADVDLILRFLNQQRFYTVNDTDDNGIVLEQDTLKDESWWNNDILQTESEDVLYLETLAGVAGTAVGAYDGILTEDIYNFIKSNLIDSKILDIDGNGSIDIRDGGLLLNYYLETLTDSKLDSLIDPSSTRRYYNVIKDYIDRYAGKKKFEVSPTFSNYIESSSFDPTGSYLAPYITTIGLYNDDNQLLMVGKLGRPIKNLIDWPVNIIVRFDT
jgi:hypothetical protein